MVADVASACSWIYVPLLGLGFCSCAVLDRCFAFVLVSSSIAFLLLLPSLHFGSMHRSFVHLLLPLQCRSAFPWSQGERTAHSQTPCILGRKGCGGCAHLQLQNSAGVYILGQCDIGSLQRWDTTWREARAIAHHGSTGESDLSSACCIVLSFCAAGLRRGIGRV